MSISRGKYIVLGEVSIVCSALRRDLQKANRWDSHDQQVCKLYVMFICALDDFQNLKHNLRINIKSTSDLCVTLFYTLSSIPR